MKANKPGVNPKTNIAGRAIRNAIALPITNAASHAGMFRRAVNKRIRRYIVWRRASRICRRTHRTPCSASASFRWAFAASSGSVVVMRANIIAEEVPGTRLRIWPVTGGVRKKNPAGISRIASVPLPRHRLPKCPPPSVVPLPFDDKSPGRMNEPIPFLKSVHTKHFSQGHPGVAVGHWQIRTSSGQYVAQFHFAPFASGRLR